MSEITRNSRIGRTKLENSNLSNETISVFNKIYSFLLEKEPNYENKNTCYFSVDYYIKDITRFWSGSNYTNLCFPIDDVERIFNNNYYIKHKSNILNCCLRYRNDGNWYNFVIIHNFRFTGMDNRYIKCKKCDRFSNYYDKKTEICLNYCEN